MEITRELYMNTCHNWRHIKKPKSGCVPLDKCTFAQRSISNVSLSVILLSSPPISCLYLSGSIDKSDKLSSRCIFGKLLYVMVLNIKCYKIPLRQFCTVLKMTEEDAITAGKEAILRQFSENYCPYFSSSPWNYFKSSIVL